MKINIYELKEKDHVAYNLVKASWIQKAIRRGENSKALSIADLYLNDNQEKGLIRRLKVFATEDIGFGNIDAIKKMNELKYDPLKCINLLSQSFKNREVDRFLLQIDRNFNNYKEIEELKSESYNLKKILNISEEWFNNKRIKKNKHRIIHFIDLLKEKYKTNEYQNELTDIALQHYFDLSRFKTLGARTNLAFIILLITRGIHKNNVENNVDLDFNKTEKLSIVDDWAIDKHTPFGKILKRDYEFWLKQGSIVKPELLYEELYYIDKEGNKKEKYPNL